MKPRSVRASAPGKIILSGEHAVVHGAPALVTAVQCRAEASVEPFAGPGVRIRLPDLGISSTLTPGEIRQAGERAARRYEAFLEGRCDIKDVLDHPSGLLQLCLLEAAEARVGPDLEGCSLEVTSGIPVGRGMGSSAAILVAALQALAASTGEPLDRPALVERAQQAERYQHGRPSGVDANACARGGSFLYRSGAGIEEAPLAFGPLYLVDTGEPASTTGECVEAVRRGFQGDPIWGDFEEVTLALTAELQKPVLASVADLVRRNHELLVRIGIVPARVRTFIEGLHRAGYAAKVCGAGAVRGDRAGMVLVCGDQAPRAPCVEAGYPLRTLELDEDGVAIHS